ncbi:MAG: hypothetical protein A2452_02140 [Candidatus Firestonebacteria bacterium RIFOXYC2_FULL_39_67]|nr:MAG: hypothetical protein A2536_07030 [Candidatus Firestonebacteria bacterium RIFOXYD2_FULL_39_29]OGF57544.1 MAG: hypothetical protein A2452_02140 [Candidatus Firestonebacteria bacterium RIFOXYC2_FULL_39_67]
MNTRIFAVVLCITNSGICLSSTGNTSGTVLIEDIGAKGAGLAGACSSLIGDITLLRYNPASIADLSGAQLSALYYNSGTTGINYGSITYGMPVGIGVLGLNVSYMNGGEMELNFIDGSTTNVLSEQDISGSVSLGISLGAKLGIGVSVKALSSTLVGSKSALAFAGDAGAVYKGFILDGLNIGASMSNLGLGIKYLDTTESLPLNVQGGASYSILGLAEDLKVTIAVDGVYSVNDKVFGLKAGVEGDYKEYSGRVGIPFNSTADQSFTVGAGYKFDNYSIDYGAVFGRALGLSHRISVGMRLEEEEKQGRQRQKAKQVKWKK